MIHHPKNADDPMGDIPADSPIRRRTESERAAYIQGFEAGARAVLDEVARLNFSHVARMAEPRLSLYLDAVRFTDGEAR